MAKKSIQLKDMFFIGIELLIKSTDEVDLREVPKNKNKEGQQRTSYKEERRRRDLRRKKRKSEEEDYSLLSLQEQEKKRGSKETVCACVIMKHKTKQSECENKNRE